MIMIYLLPLGGKVIKSNQSNLGATLLQLIQKNLNHYKAHKINYNYFLIGIDENDPLCHSMKNFRCFTYDAIVYLVDYSTKIKIEDRIKYLEISRL